MSWSFTHRSKDKEKLKAASLASFKESQRYCGDEGAKAVEPVVNLLMLAIDTAVVAPEADYIEVACSGHAEWITSPPEKAGLKLCYFTLSVMPVYLPHTLD